MSTVPRTDICKRMEHLIALEKATIKRIKQMIATVTAELKRLNAAPKPDRERIEAVRTQLAELNEQLAGTEDGLRQVEEDHFQFCSPVQPHL
jgi:predicted  nucleic acid-binding Zn-ribbon protein